METLILNGERFKVLELISSRNSGGRINKALISSLDTDTRYLLKSSTPFGHEPISEAMAHRIGITLGFSVCPYELIKSTEASAILHCKNPYISICPMLDTPTKQVLSITHIKNELNSQRVMLGQTQLSNLDTAKLVLSKEAFDRLIFFDALIGNKDRHWRNVHIFKDINGTYSECPMIDNGDSLLATNFIPYSKPLWNKSSTIASTHDKQVESITTVDTSNFNPIEVAGAAVESITDLAILIGRFRGTQVQKYLYNRIIKYYTLFQRK